MARPSRNAPDSDLEDMPKARISGQTLREAAELGRYLLPYRLKFGAALVALLLSSLAALAFPTLAGLLINNALGKGSTIHPLLNSINGVTLALVVVLAIQAGFSFLRVLWFVEVGERSLADLRRDAFGRILRLPMSFHVQRRVGELASRIAADLAQIQDTVIGVVPQLLRQIVLLAGGVTLILLTSTRLALLMLVSFPTLIGLAVLFGRSLRRISREAQDRLADSNVIVEETLQGITSVKAFTNEGFEEGRYRNSLDAFVSVVLREARYRGAFLSFIVFALFGAIVLVLWYGARLVQAGDIDLGSLASFLIYTMFIGGALGSFAELYSDVQRALGASQRVRELLREPAEPAAGSAPAVRLRGDVVFENVAFSYPSRKEVEVLHDVSLTARAGERIALVGPSGAGKSTLVSLLLRFYDPDRGRILIDGRDSRDYDLHGLRGGMAVVPQDVLLFGGTLAENIAYGRPGAAEAEIIEAARQANAHDFIVSFPEGYQTRVGERGMQLSGGQRQRVAIARALLRDPAILILDEATSSLDSESESLVLQALDRLMRGRTALVIAHRLSTVRRADRIFVLKEGRIVEAGTHDEPVLREGGVYQMLSRLQFNGAIDSAPSTGAIHQ